MSATSEAPQDVPVSGGVRKYPGLLVSPKGVSSNQTGKNGKELPTRRMVLMKLWQIAKNPDKYKNASAVTSACKTLLDYIPSDTVASEEDEAAAEAELREYGGVQ